jgi:hypothetical protein
LHSLSTSDLTTESSTFSPSTGYRRSRFRRGRPVVTPPVILRRVAMKSMSPKKRPKLGTGLLFYADPRSPTGGLIPELQVHDTCRAAPATTRSCGEIKTIRRPPTTFFCGNRTSRSQSIFRTTEH